MSLLEGNCGVREFLRADFALPCSLSLQLTRTWRSQKHRECQTGHTGPCSSCRRKMGQMGKIQLRGQRAGMLQNHQCAIMGSRVWQNHPLSSFEGSANLVITALMENPAQHIIPTEKQTLPSINKVPLKLNIWLSHKLLLDLCCLSTHLAGSCWSSMVNIYVRN